MVFGKKTTPVKDGGGGWREFIGSDPFPVARHPDISVMIVPVGPVVSEYDPAPFVDLSAVLLDNGRFVMTRHPDIVSAQGARGTYPDIASIGSGPCLDDHATGAVRRYRDSHGPNASPDDHAGLRLRRFEEGNCRQDKAGHHGDDHEAVLVLQSGIHGVFLSLWDRCLHSVCCREDAWGWGGGAAGVW